MIEVRLGVFDAVSLPCQRVVLANVDMLMQFIAFKSLRATSELYTFCERGKKNQVEGA